MLAAFDAAAHEPGVFEHADVLGRGGEGHLQGLGEFTQVSLALREGADHRPPGRVGKGVEDAVEEGGGI